MRKKNHVPYHIFPVQHLQDVAQQLATGLQLLLLLQVELQLVGHQWQEDLAAICGDTPRTHSMSWWWTAWGHTADVLDALWVKTHAGWSRLPRSSKRSEDDAQDGCNSDTECVATSLIARVCTGTKWGWFRRRVFQLYEGRKTYLRGKKKNSWSLCINDKSAPTPTFSIDR